MLTSIRRNVTSLAILEIEDYIRGFRVGKQNKWYCRKRQSLSARS